MMGSRIPSSFGRKPLRELSIVSGSVSEKISSKSASTFRM